MPKICSPHVCEPIGTVLVASIRGILTPFSFAPVGEQFTIECDFSPVVAERIRGELWPISQPQLCSREAELRGEHNFNDNWRMGLLPGFSFKIFGSRWAKIKDSAPIGHGVIVSARYSNCYYEADAEVQVELLESETTEVFPSGRLFEFLFEEQGKKYRGHLDQKGIRSMDLGPSNFYDPKSQCKTGNAFLCLHNLTLSHRNPNPAGRPLFESQEFVILKDDGLAGRGVVTRVLPGSPIVRLCHPSIPGYPEIDAEEWG